MGGPAWQKDSTYLYLAGEYAEEAADLFSGGPLIAEVIGKEAGRASAPASRVLYNIISAKGLPLFYRGSPASRRPASGGSVSGT